MQIVTLFLKDITLSIFPIFKSHPPIIDAAQSQAELALYYPYGIGVDPTMELTTYWYKKAIKQDYILTQFKIGSFYEQGISVETNMTLTIE